SKEGSKKQRRPNLQTEGWLGRPGNNPSGFSGYQKESEAGHFVATLRRDRGAGSRDVLLRKNRTHVAWCSNWWPQPNVQFRGRFVAHEGYLLVWRNIVPGSTPLARCYRATEVLEHR